MQSINIFNELNKKIIENTDDEEKLEAAVFDSADIQMTLSEKLALISHTLERALCMSKLCLNQLQLILTKILNTTPNSSSTPQLIVETLHPRTTFRRDYKCSKGASID